MTDLWRGLLDAADLDDLAELAKLLSPLMPPPAAQAEDGWLTSRDAADYLGISLDALHKRTRRRAIPAVQESDGGKLYFRRSDLDRWRIEHSNGA